MNTFIEKIAGVLVDRKWLLFILLCMITVGGSVFLVSWDDPISPKIKMDNSLEIWFLEDDPARVSYNEFKEIYGSDEVISAWVQPKTDGAKKDVLNKEFVQQIYDASVTIEENPLIKRVLSITKTPYIDGKKGELIVEDMVKKRPDDSYKAEVLKERIKSNPLWEKLLFNKAGTATMIIIEPERATDMNDLDSKRPEILKFVRDSLKGIDFKLAGMGVAYDEINKVGLKDTMLFTSIAFTLLLVLLAIFFRRLSIYITAMVTMTICMWIFMDISGLFNQNLNVVYGILPTVISILCLADIIHVFSHYDKTAPGENRLKRNLSFVLIPCFLTTVTTAAGFSALSSSPMKILKSFGIFAAVGVFIAFFVSMIISALVLGVKEKRDAAKEASGKTVKAKKEGNDIFDKILSKINTFVHNQYKLIVGVGAVLIVVGIFGITRVNVDTHSLNFLLDSNQVKQDSKFIEGDYGYYLPLEIRIKPKNDDGVKDPDFLRKLDALQKVIDKKESFEDSTSIAEVVKHLNRVLTDNKQASYVIPQTRNEVAQELLLYDMDEDNDLSFFVEEEYEEARFTVRIPMVSSKTMKGLIAEAETEIRTIFKDDVDIKFGGYVPLYVKMMEYIIESQISSFLIAFVIIFALMALLFRSYSVLLIGIVPNLMPIFMTLGFMGLTGVNLDIATVTIAAIAIGISVDDTIHFIFMYKKKKGEGCTTSEAVEHTIGTTGKAIIITSMLLIFGYSALLFASIKSVIFFGLLIAVAMIFAVIADLFLLPSLLLLFSKDKEVEQK
ncbi:MAG: MMPL family transporter [bacterium]|nr:MMPL family transporter [bacterium]